MAEIKNATISGAEIKYDQGAFLTMWLTLDYGGAGQGYGGFCFCSPIHDKDGAFKGREITGAAFGRAVDGILKTVGVEKWSDLKGKPIRVEAEHSKVHRIGHYLKDRWFRYEDAFRTPTETGDSQRDSTGSESDTSHSLTEDGR